MDADERLIRAIQQINDPEADPARIESDAESDNSECHPVAPERVDADMQRLMDDMALRNHHGIGGAFTGPKGVIADRKFHRQQELARAALKLERDNAQMSQKAMSKGWLNRQPDSSKTFYQQEEEDDNFLAEYRMKRISQLASNTSNSQVHELDFNSYVSFIDDAHPSTRVIIHLYQAQIEPCRIINTLMTSLASEYPDVKFGKIISTEADPDFDAIALPAVLVYQQGELINTLLRIDHEIPDWKETGRCCLEDFEQYLCLQDVLSKQIVPENDESSESDDERDY